MTTLDKMTWYQEDTETVLKKLQSHETGLEENEAHRRLDKYGPNRLAKAKKDSLVKRFLLQFNNLLIYVLIASALITTILQHVMDTIVILAVVLINALIGLIQEGKAEKALEAIAHMLAQQAFVLRDGKVVEIAAEQLVPGDIILLKAGDKIPADAYLLHARNLRIQEAILTGESLPVDKKVCVLKKDTPLFERCNMTYSGTIITNGEAKAVVVNTGASTEIGQISGLISQIDKLETPLIRQMTKFAKWVTTSILFIATSLMIYGYFFQERPFQELFMAVVALSVAAIPEGLPTVLTITLAIGVRAMAKRHAIVRVLPTIETLGSISVICTDKTGTLTLNQMKVASVFVNNEANKITLAKTALLCNSAQPIDEGSKLRYKGDPMEIALMDFASSLGLDVENERKKWPTSDMIPFDTDHAFMASLNHNHQTHACIYVKGAPEKINAMSEKQLSPDGQLETINKEHWHQQIKAMASQGQRVLAFAFKSVSIDKHHLEFSDLEQNLVFIGIVGLIDPPRSESKQAIADCHQAGIQVKMITGDHLETAIAIAKQIGIENPEQALTGKDIEQLSDDALSSKAIRIIGMARCIDGF